MDKLDKAVPVLSTIRTCGEVFWFADGELITLEKAIALAKAGECNYTQGAYDAIKKHLPAAPAVVDGAIDKSRSTQNARR